MPQIMEAALYLRTFFGLFPGGFKSSHRLLRVARVHASLAPDAKIAFLTQNGDSEVAQAAISDGADGYILKMDAETELLTTLDAVVGVDDFLSRGIGRSDSDKTAA
jgi:DNA-binding NarL/FixJ family response regulator